MKLLDKLKNMFFEEEYVEVEEEEKRPIKKEKVNIAKKIEVPERKREVPILEEEEKQEELLDKDLLKNETSFKFPVILEEDFIEPEKPKVDHKREEKNNYSQPYGYKTKVEPVKHEYYAYEKKEVTTKKSFKPSPIISPIYGLIDKEYKKEETVTRKEVRLTSYSTNKLDIDSVRKKAYGSLESDIVSAIDDNYNVVDEEHEEMDDETNLLVDMREEVAPSVDKVTVGDAEEYFHDLGLEYNVDYKDKSKEKATGRRVKPEVKDDIEEQEDEEPTLEDNLFDLIDSMYEDKE